MLNKSILLLSIFLTGCSTTDYWKHHSKQPSEFQQDQAYCLNGAINAIPNMAVPNQPMESRVLQPKSYDTTCTPGFGAINCRTTPNMGPVSAFERYQISPQAQMNDAVNRTRVAYVESCLVRMGWTKLDSEMVNKAQQDEAARKASFEAAQKKLNSDISYYTEKICKSNKYTPVTRLAPCSIAELDASHLSNSDYINQSQKNLFIDVSRENSKMNDSVIDFYKNFASPELRSKLIDVQIKKRNAEIDNDADLMNAKINWGDYNRVNRQIAEDYKREMEFVKSRR